MLDDAVEPGTDAFSTFASTPSVFEDRDREIALTVVPDVMILAPSGPVMGLVWLPPAVLILTCPLHAASVSGGPTTTVAAEAADADPNAAAHVKA